MAKNPVPASRKKPPKAGELGSLQPLLAAIVEDDRAAVKKLLKSEPALATASAEKEELYDGEILHWLYVGDTPLHLAAAGYRLEIARLLLTAGADPNADGNRRRSTPLHYAADGFIMGPAWNEKRQVKTIECLLSAGANINAQDKNGATPLHRAIRTRCAAAVRCLLEAGANAALKNKPGSTPFHLAVQNTGSGGSGADPAKAAQQKIVDTLLAYGVSTNVKDGRGKTVRECATSAAIREMLT